METRKALSPKQKTVLEYVDQYVGTHGFAPSRREIASGLGLRSVATVQQHIDALTEKGWLTHESGRARAIECLPEDPIERAWSIPLAGRVAAGKPIEAIETHETIAVPETLLPRRSMQNLFVLQVSGTSMIDDGILNGDYVIIERSSEARNGQTVVALIDGEATLKKFYKKKNTVELHPANATLLPIVVRPEQRFEVLGVFRALYRRVA